MRLKFFTLVLFCFISINLKAQTSTRFEVTNIELIRQSGKNFLKIAIQDKQKDAGFYSYPIFKVVSNGKTIAERGLSSYGLVETELIPTKLKELPKNFTCVVFLSSQGGTNAHQMEYKAK
jgi:hypothetical protein